MKTYQYTTTKGFSLRLKFSSSIYPEVKKALGVVTDLELQKNPYNEKVLSICVYEFYKRACKDSEDEPIHTLKDIQENLEVDEMLYIYTMVALERSANLNANIKAV